MKLRLSFFVISLLIMASCATDQPIGPEPDSGESDFTILEQAGEAILKALDQHEGDRQALISAIRAIPQVETLTEVQDNIDGEPIDQLDLILTDGTPYLVNLVEKETEPEMSQAESDRLDSMLDSIQNLFDSKIPDISVNAQSAPSPGSGLSPLSAPTRATPWNNRSLTKKKAILLSLDTDLRKEDIKYINKIKNDKDKVAVQIVWDIPAIEKITPDFFTTLANYDIVVVGCHGLVSGEIFFPSDCMSASLRQKYNELVVKNKKGQASSYQESGVHPGTMTYRSGKKRPGFYLDNKFFDKYLPPKGTLSSTIFWSVHCFSSFLNNKSFKGLDYECNVRDAADYFGSGTLCLGSEVYPLFMQWYKQLVNGVESDVAWKNSLPHCKYQPFQKVFSSGRNYYSSTLSKAKYLVPQATGVRSTRTRASDKAAPVVVGARFRYSGDRTGKPEYTGNGGILLREVATGYTSTVPITSDMIQSQRPVEVLEGFVVNEIDVRIDGLKPETDYVYATYIDSDGAMTVSDESFAFRTEKASGQVYYISTEDEFIQIMSKYHEGMAFLTKDITITKWQLPYIRTSLNGQGHNLHFEYQGSSVVEFTKGSNESIHKQCMNVNISFKNSYTDGNEEKCRFCSYWKVQNCKFSGIGVVEADENAEISNCRFENSKAYVYGVLKDCKFLFTPDYEYFTYYPPQVITNYGLVERCTLEENSFSHPYGAFLDNRGTVTDCHLKNDTFVPFCSLNMGKISNCSVTCGSYFDSRFTPVWEAEWGGYFTYIPNGCVEENRGTIEGLISDIGMSYQFNLYLGEVLYSAAGVPLCSDNSGKLIRCVNRSNVLNYYRTRSAAVCSMNTGEVIDCENYGEIAAELPPRNENGPYNNTGYVVDYVIAAGVINCSKSAKVTGFKNHGTYKLNVLDDLGKPFDGITYLKGDVVYIDDKDTEVRRKGGARINKTRINKNVNKRRVPHRGPMNKKRPSPRSRVR